MRGWQALRVRFAGTDVYSVLLALLFFVCVGSPFSSRTEDGVQCPTAPVQTVMKAIKSPCGCVIGYRVSAPKPGDKGFVQCRCAEKKSAERTVWRAPKNEALPMSVASVDVPFAPCFAFDFVGVESGFVPVVAAPLIHPPTLV